MVLVVSLPARRRRVTALRLALDAFCLAILAAAAWGGYRLGRLTRRCL